jgi:Fibronectin type III domain
MQPDHQSQIRVASAALAQEPAPGSRRQTFCTFLCLFTMLCSFAQAAPSVTLAWDANVEPDIGGYKLHYGTSSGAYTQTIDVGNIATATVPNLPVGTTYFFVVTAYNLDGVESLPSNEACYTQRPPASVSLTTQSIGPEDAAEFGPCETAPPGTTSTYAAHCLPDRSYQFAIKGPAGRSVNIYTSTDLTTWTWLATVPNPTGFLLVTDLEAASRALSRFYQVFQEARQSASLATQSINQADAGEYSFWQSEPVSTTCLPTAHSLANGIYQFATSGRAGRSLSIYASSDLSIWTLLGTVPNPSGYLLVTDIDAEARALRRFYQVLEN